MIYPATHPVHLTYSMNVHPGERFQDQWDAIKVHAAAVRARLHADDRPFGLGLRLSHAAVRDVLKNGILHEFKSWCDERGFYVFTINGFPYGDFHTGPVKAQVYRPDWTTRERLEYTLALADMLAVLLPAGTPGSISTVPGWYAPDHVGKAAGNRACHAAIRHLADAAIHLEKIALETGRDLCVGLEPEPGCLLETIEDVVSFFEDKLIPRARALLAADRPEWKDHEAVLRRRIGICLDVCHCAIAYEDPAQVLRQLQANNIRIAKIQLSAALAADLRNERNRKTVLRSVMAFAEPVYFHQTSARHSGRIRRWIDLPEAMDHLEAEKELDDMRVHFHVPLHWPGEKKIESTRRIMTDQFWSMIRDGVCPHLEIETYTFHVLPRKIAGKNLAASIEKEYRWVLEQEAGRDDDATFNIQRPTTNS